MMVDDIKNIDKPLSPLFRTHKLNKVREVSKRPEEDRGGRDTYSESDELLLSKEAELLKKAKAERDKLAAGKAKEARKPEKPAQTAQKTPDNSPEEDEQDGTKKHVDIKV